MNRAASLALVAESEWIREFVRWAKGDPKLSAWECTFINDIGHLAEGRAPSLSNNQVSKLKEIADRLGYGSPDPVPIATEDDDSLPEGEQLD